MQTVAVSQESPNPPYKHPGFFSACQLWKPSAIDNNFLKNFPITGNLKNDIRYFPRPRTNLPPRNRPIPIWDPQTQIHRQHNNDPKTRKIFTIQSKQRWMACNLRCSIECIVCVVRRPLHRKMPRFRHRHPKLGHGLVWDNFRAHALD